MDIADMAQEAEALILQQAMRRASHPAHILTACGRCHNCDASVPPGTAFCDQDCRDDWQRRNPTPKRGV
jgi:cytochrome c553